MGTKTFRKSDFWRSFCDAPPLTPKRGASLFCIKNRSLMNEKYRGDVLLQKKYTADFLTKKQVKNNGEVPQYYVEGDHPAIIPPRRFELAQAELQKRKRKKKYSGVSIFSSKIICGECSGYFGSKVWHSTDKYRRVIWRCNREYGKGKKCSTPHLSEDEIKTLFLKALNRLLTDKEEIIANMEMLKESVTVYGKEEATFLFKGGTEIRVKKSD